MSNLYDLTIKEAGEKLVSGEITSVELTKSVLDRIEEMEPTINAFISIYPEKALEQAKEIDSRRAKGEELNILAGIPYSLKDVYNAIDTQTTAGSKVLEGYISPYNATVQQILEDKGAVLVGKTNCDPFGFGSSTEWSAYGITKNPIDTSRVPGGSSGGSGASVAYGGGLFSIGEDTGGSIRCPASFCGITGMKVTYGRVSRYGSIAYASSYDSVGPMTRNVEDNAIVLREIAGVDPKDATSSPTEVPDYVKTLSKDIKGLKIGIPKEYFDTDMDSEVKEKMEESIEKLKSMGCEIIDITLPYTKYAIAAYYVVGIAEASSNLGRMDGIRFGLDIKSDDWKEKIQETRQQGFTDEEKRRVMVGTFALSAGYSDQFYNKAQKVRALLRKDFKRAFKEVDVIIAPTMPVLPFKIGENTSDPLKMWLVDAYTVSINPIGIPALSINAGYSKEGLPVGLQLIGPHFREDLLYNLAYKFENHES